MGIVLNGGEADAVEEKILDGRKPLAGGKQEGTGKGKAHDDKGAESFFEEGVSGTTGQGVKNDLGIAREYLKGQKEGKGKSAEFFSAQYSLGRHEEPGHPGHGVHRGVAAQVIVSAGIEEADGSAEEGPKRTDLEVS